jgi:hypothetical protein
MELDEPLQSVVDGKWDREKFAATFKEQQEMAQLMSEVQRSIGGLVRKKKFDEALAKADEFIEKVNKPELKLQLNLMKMSLHQIAGSEGAELAKTLEAAIDLAGDNPMMANQVAWTAYEMHSEGKLDSKSTLKKALELASKSVQKLEGETKGLTLDTIAHLQLILVDAKTALATQKQALELVKVAQQRESLEEFLEELEAAVKGK